MVLEWRPVFPLREMWLATGSQKPQARPFANKLLNSSLLKPIMGYWQAMTQLWILQMLITPRKRRERRSQTSCTEWPRSTTFWRCGSTAKSYMLHRTNLGLKISKWLPLDTFQILQRLSKRPGQTLNMMVQLHLNRRKDHLCHQLCLERTSLEDDLKKWMSAKSNESTIILPNLMRIVHQEAFWTLKIGLTGIGTWIIQPTAKTTARQTMNLT